MNKAWHYFARKLCPVLVGAGWVVAAHGAPLDAGIETTASAQSGAKADAICERGLAEYEIGHYAQAIQYFRSAAELGDARSPELLALMYRFGGQLYGDQVRANAIEAARWAAVAAEQRWAADTIGTSAKQ